MKTIRLREFAELDQVAMLNMTERRYKVEVIDDQGEKVITDSWLLAINWYTLIPHRYFHQEPYHIDEVIVLKSKEGRQSFIDDDKLKHPVDNFLARIMPKNDDPAFYDMIKQLIFVYHNACHNYLCVKSEHGVVSARSMDVLHVIRNPKIADLKKRVQSGQTCMADGAKEFEQIMMTEPDFDKSVFGLLYRTRSVSSVQSFQLVIARGDVTDLNGTILPNTIMESYADGITNLADSLADSKGAGFSLISNGQALQDSEWFHKKIHNVAQVVKGINYQQDCGSTTGTVVKIISKEFKQSLSGKWRILEDGSLELLVGKALDKIETGEKVTYRSVAWCRHGRTGRPCSVCFGKMESALPYNPYTKRGAVPGLFYGSTLAEPIGQSILKTKHRIGSASAKGFVVNRADADYITGDESGDYIYFKKEILNEDSNPYLILDKETQQDFSDFKFMENLEDIDLSRVLRTYETIKLRVSISNPMFESKKAVHYPIITTTVASRDARMTRALVEYLLEQPIEEEGKTFKISLKGFDPKEPAFELPQVNEDLDAYRKRVENKFKFDEVKNRWDHWITPEIFGEYVVSLWKVIDEKYKGANIIMTDIFLWACSAIDPNNLNYGLPGETDKRVFVSLHESIIHGGMSNALVYGYQHESLLSEPYRFLVKNRKSGALEAFMNPIAIK